MYCLDLDAAKDKESKTETEAEKSQTAARSGAEVQGPKGTLKGGKGLLPCCYLLSPTCLPVARLGTAVEGRVRASSAAASWAARLTRKGMGGIGRLGGVLC